MEVARSAGIFLLGVIKRFYFYLPALLLDPFDFYEKYLRAWIQREFWPSAPRELAVSPWITWSLLGVGLILACVMTYHDLRKYIGRNPKVSKALQSFYSRSTQLLYRPISTKEDLERLRSDFAEWRQEISEWVKDNMGEPAYGRLITFEVRWPFTGNKATVDGHQQTLNSISHWHHNLQALIENTEWR